MLLLEGVILSIAGIGTVFLFLMLLVWLMGVTSRCVRALEAKGFGVGSPAPGTAPSTPVGQDRLAAVIAVAHQAFTKGN